MGQPAHSTQLVGHRREGGHSRSQELLDDGKTTALLIIYGAGTKGGGSEEMKHMPSWYRTAGRMGKQVGGRCGSLGGREKELRPAEK